MPFKKIIELYMINNWGFDEKNAKYLAEELYEFWVNENQIALVPQEHQALDRW